MNSEKLGFMAFILLTLLAIAIGENAPSAPTYSESCITAEARQPLREIVGPPEPPRYALATMAAAAAPKAKAHKPRPATPSRKPQRTVSTDDPTGAYIAKYQHLALDKSARGPSPASIKMAQAILESNRGLSGLTRLSRNHFGIKCHSKTCKKGHCTNKTDDNHKDFFVNYTNAEASWRAHGELLRNSRYGDISLECGNDYKCWAKALKARGYATAPDYAERLVSLIRTYHLDHLDTVGPFLVD